MTASNMLQNTSHIQHSAVAPPARAAREHAIDYRISFSVLGQQLYLVVLAGDDRRSVERLERDGQLRSFVLLAFKALLLTTFALGVATILIGGAVVIVYLLKTLAGIDLFEGTSFLHGLLG